MDEKKYSVIYYDLESTDPGFLISLGKQLEEFNKKENVNFLLLPRTVKQEWMSKEELLASLEDLKKEVESWE